MTDDGPREAGMTDEDPQAARAERDLADLEQRTEELGAEIDQARSDLVDTDDTPVTPIEGAVGDSPEDAGPEPETEGAPKGWG
jgi:hypothetical protein